MTSVFIVRPFGEKPVRIKDKDGNDTTVQVDFDTIDRLLIQPALKKNGLDGETTGVIAEAGNIRVDMFQMLIAYDLVIADISIHNANVFYELGIRHGLRPNGTILMRFPAEGMDVPFDLKTERYFSYERETPAAGVDALARAIEATLRAMRDSQPKADSPVFLLLPKLKAPDPAALIAVPREFQEAVEKAEKQPGLGRTTLALLAEEARRSHWTREGRRLVGKAQRRMTWFEAARATWELIRKELPNDIEANLQLATIYQRLGSLVDASQACRRVLENAAAERKDRADARSQLARNDKALWVAGYSTLPTVEARRQEAIADKRLQDAFAGYMDGFSEDLNDYYSGLNALGLLSAILGLAEAEPDAWAGNFEKQKEADRALDDYRDQLESLRGAVSVSLENAQRRAEAAGTPDEWLPPSEAQYKLLTATKAEFVRRAYKAAKDTGGKGFSIESEARQVGIFHSLGLFSDNCSKALEALEVAPEDAQPMDQSKAPPRGRVIVATGHRADAPDRPPPPRFPNTTECIAKAKAWLRQAIEAEKAETTGPVSAIGGAASGTDLLFHEACKELGIPSTVVLPIPIEDYRRRSVADGGPEWVEMFNRLVAEKPPIILGDEDKLPHWAETIPGYGVFQRGNIWMIEHALLTPNAAVTLLALWDGKGGDGPGGTADMVALAQSRSAKTRIGNTDELFAIG